MTCALPLALVSENAEVLRAESCDLSLAGVGIETFSGREVEVGEELSVLVLGRRAVSAEVCWKRAGRLGLRFLGNIGEIATSWVGDFLADQRVMFREILPGETGN